MFLLLFLNIIYINMSKICGILTRRNHDIWITQTIRSVFLTITSEGSLTEFFF